jgi:hypothetical protein
VQLNTLLIDGHNGTLSSKRVITFLAFILCSIAFIADLFWGYKISPNLFDGMIYIAIAGLGVTASEKFANKISVPQTQSQFMHSSKSYVPINKQTKGTPLPKTKDYEI